MPMRPIDIARRLGVSTTTLRNYEELDMVPDVLRSPTGYRIYTAEHIAYFICIREMLHGFTISQIAKALKLVMERQIDEALWMANKAQVALQKDKYIAEQIKQRFLFKTRFTVSKDYTIDDISKATGVTPSTIRYWNKIGLISVKRCIDNNYRTFTETHIDEILMLCALKLSMRAQGEKYAVEHIRKEIAKIDCDDTDMISAIVAGIERYLAGLNRAQIRSISALYNLCNQVEKNQYDVW